MIIRRIKKLDVGARGLAVYYKGRDTLPDEIIGIEVLGEDSRVLEWIGETEADSSNIKYVSTFEVGRITTGYYREVARNYADVCDWKNALEFYKKALEVFPEIPEGLTLLRADYESLCDQVKALEHMVRTEK